LRKGGSVPVTSSVVERLSDKKIEINFDVLKNPILKKLQPFEIILPLEQTVKPEEPEGVKAGRDNPFLPMNPKPEEESEPKQ